MFELEVDGDGEAEIGDVGPVEETVGEDGDGKKGEGGESEEEGR